MYNRAVLPCLFIFLSIFIILCINLSHLFKTFLVKNGSPKHFVLLFFSYLYYYYDIFCIFIYLYSIYIIMDYWLYKEVNTTI